jgi:lipoprotein-releasing system ATP-binding protein
MTRVLELEKVVKSFEQAGEKLEVLKGCDLTISSGEMVALVGPSGSGKSTLMHIAGLLESPSAGTIRISQQDASRLNDKKRTKLRSQTIGFVYQYHHLLPEFSALENVVLPQLINGKTKKAARERAASLLEQVGLGSRMTHRPARLSGGEQQRVAIARALANEPALLLADEPTGNLDPDTSEMVFAMLLELTKKNELAALIATHNHQLAIRMDRVIELGSGLIKEKGI